MSTVPNTVIRSGRKRLALVIDSEANLVVRAPQDIKESDISAFIEKKEHWIALKQKHVSVFHEKHNDVVVKTGECLLYLGTTYTIITDAIPNITFASSFIYIPNNYTKDDIMSWLKDRAGEVFSARASRYANLLGVTYTSIKLSNAQTRWGSCSASNDLNFAWRLIMYPLASIDYIVVHELSHITYRNHSSAFWARVKTVLPNYEEQQDWLQINRRLLEIF
ncbi:MAG: M48 family metallopeptidase [Anaerolineae bacterium]